VPRRLLALLLVPVLLLGACGDDDDDPEDDETTTTTAADDEDDDDGSTTTTSSTSTSTTSTSTTTTVPFDGSTSPTSAPPPPGSTEVAQLVAVRVAGQPGADRVVFEFRGTSLPGFDVAYADGPVLGSGSGEPIDVDGEAALLIRMEPASGVDLNTPDARPTYTGPDRVRGDTSNITEVVKAGDFEANLEWAIGVRRQAPFRITVLEAPARVVVDLAP
jgi:hypothetical protein